MCHSFNLLFNTKAKSLQEFISWYFHRTKHETKFQVALSSDEGLLDHLLLILSIQPQIRLTTSLIM